MSEGQKPMPDSKVKELSDMPWKQREESRTWQKERVIQETHDQTAYDPSGCHTERKVELL